jgi:hypothetical protein
MESDPIDSEKQFDLPALFVNFRNGAGTLMKMIRQEFRMVPGLRIAITDAAQTRQAWLLGFNAGQGDRLLAGESRYAINRAACLNPPYRILPHMCCKEYPFLIQSLEPPISIGVYGAAVSLTVL